MSIISGSITTNSDYIQADGADDIIDALAGDDTIIGGSGNDTLSGNTGNDNLYGEDGNDILNGGDGNDYLDGGVGDDTIKGGAGIDNILIDGIGNDTVDGGADEDRLGINQSGATTAINISYTSVTGGNIQNIESVGIQTGSGDDNLNISAAVGSPSYWGSNYVYAGAGNDIVVGGSGADSLYGQDGNDNLSGGTGNDTLDAGVGDDTLNGDIGIDYLIIDGIGNDSVDGGADEDRLQVSASGATTAININYTSVTGGNIQNVESVGIQTGSGDDNLNISAAVGSPSYWGGNSVYAGAGNDTVISGSGNDNLYGEDGNDTLNGGDGNDTLDAGVGDDTLNGDAGNDNLVIDGIGNDNVDGGSGEDRLGINQSGATTAININYTSVTGGNIQNIESVGIQTGSGDDNLNISASVGSPSYWGSNYVYAGAGNDIVVGGSGADSLYGQDGNDNLSGGAGNDYIQGETGNDILEGVNGTLATPGLAETDTLFGGTESDRFILANTTSVYYDDGNTSSSGSNDYAYIADFNPLEDKVQLQGAAANYLLVTSGSNTELYINKPGSEPDELIAFFQGVTGLNLTSSAFEYVAPVVIPPNGTIDFSSATYTVNENDGTAQITLTRSGTTTGQASITVALTDGTANAPGDYDNNPITVTFNNGETSKTIFIPIVNDTFFEQNETVSLSLINQAVGTTIGTQSTATLTIIEDDIPVPGILSFSAPQYTLQEDGSTGAIVTVVRSGGSDGDVSTTVVLSDSTATAPSDYNATPITVSFTNGQTVQNIFIPLVDDFALEADETLNLALTNPIGGATIGTQGTSAVTIVDNDAPGVLEFSSAQYSLLENGATGAIVTITRTGGVGGNIGATITLSDGTAIAPGDYNATPITVNFAAGETVQTVVIPIVNDTIIESNEVLNLALTNPTGGATVGTQSNTVVTIVNDDALILSTASGDGGLAVQVNEFGQFGSSNVGGQSAFYDPLGAKTQASTTYESFVALGIIDPSGTIAARNVLSSFSGTNTVLTSASGTTANSAFTVGGLEFQLNQTVQDTLNITQARTGSLIAQTYTITNTTNQSIDFDLVRYVDGDLYFDGTLIDGGGRLTQNGQEVLFETDAGGNTQADTTFFGISATGGTTPTTNRWELDSYDLLRSNILSGNDLRDSVIQGDANSDGFIDTGSEYDVTLGLRNVFSLAPGQSTTYVSTTRFGSGDVAQVDITPPVGGINALPATTLGNDISVAWGATDPSGVQNYDVFVSVNGGAFTQWLSNVTTTTAVYTGTIGQTYSFYSLATDNAGNEQAAATAPTTTTQLINPVTLAVAPTSVNEDGTTNLVYTFTRIGSTLNPLTVSYTVGGSATLAIDYTQTGANSFSSSSGTVTFAAGSSTATVTVDPTANTIDEPNRAVTLSLANGVGYTIGTSTAVVGTILDDDGPVTPVVNTPPSGTDSTILLNEDTIYTFSTSDFGFSDPSDIPANTLSQVKITTLPTAGILKLNGLNVTAGDFIAVADITAGTLTFTPATNANGLGYASLTFQVQDNGGTTNGGIDLDQSPNTLAFNVTPVNDSATITGISSAAVTEDASTPDLTATGTLTVNDVDAGENIFSTAVTSASGNLGTLSISNTGTFSYNVADSAVQFLGAGQIKTETFTVQSFDGTATQNIIITINGVNDAPTGSSTAVLGSGTEDTPYAIAASALLQGFSDVDGDVLSIANLAVTNGTLINNNNGTYTFNPNANYNGTVNLSYNVIDGNGGSIAANQSFSLAAVNDAPTGSPTAVLSTGAEDTPYTISTSTLLTGFSDVDGDVLSIASLTATNGALVNNNNGTYTFSPNANYNGTVNLSYNVVDGNGGSIAANQSFSLAAVNDAPTLSNISKTGTANTVISFTATDFTSAFSDIDGDSLTKIQIIALPTNGTLKLSGIDVGINQEITAANLGNLTFTPNTGFSGPLSFSWNGFDGTTYAITPGTVNITVNSGSNLIQGTLGPDPLTGTDFVDIIDGKAGNDTITGKKGDDTLIGGGNRDTFVFNLGDGTDTITDFGGVGPGNYPSVAIIPEVDTLQFQGAGLTARNLLLTQNGSNLEVTFEGVSGNKVILQNFDLQNIDNHPGSRRNAVIGNILFDGQTAIADSYDVFDANSTQQGLFRRNTTTFLNDLDNTVTGFDNSDDVINGQGGNDIIRGKSGNDLLRGGAGNDTLFGGAGNDILRGGTGNDTLGGGTGNDLFVLASGEGTDTIKDFNLTLDKIGLANGLSFGQLTITQGTGSNANSALITDSTNNELLAILNGVQANTLTNGMFATV
jgi:VCBS repeat-containing protein